MLKKITAFIATSFILLFVTHDIFSSDANNKVNSIIAIDSVWARPSTEKSKNSAIYLNVHNNSGVDSKFESVSCGVAKIVELHDSYVDQNGVSRMTKLDNLTIPAHSTVSFAPGKTHIMLLDLHDSLKIGDKFKLTLKFVDIAPIEVEVEVKSK